MSDRRYTFRGLLGAGAMGQVLLAQEQSLLRHVAFKTLHPQLSEQPQVLRRFLNEMQITSQLDHPHIVPIYSMERTSEGPAYTMKLVHGDTLKDLIKTARTYWSRGEAPPPEYSQATLLDYFLKVCEAMHYAHCKGVIHRDLKPANLMIGPYREVYVMDWGIARVMQAPPESSEENVQLGGLSEDLDATLNGQILGTPRYMSPEQARGLNDRLDARSDLFALGAILFELLTLKQAFQGKSPVEILKHVLKGEREPFRHLSPKVRLDGALEAIVNKAMAPQREDRYADVAALAGDLRRFQRGEAVLARPDRLGHKALRLLRRQRDRVLFATIGLLVVTISVVLGLSYRQYLQQRAARQREQHLQALFNAVLQQSRSIDRYFLQIEKTLDAFAAVVDSTLDRGLPDKAPLYVHNGPPPADFAQASYYNGALSLDYAINLPATQLPPGRLEARMHQLSPLRHYLRRMLVDSATGGRPLPPQAERRLIAQTGVPVMWGTVVLREGLAHWYPGKDLQARRFDARTRPYYTSAAFKYGHFWGTPYIDGTGSGLLLSCSTGLFDDQNTFLGTASLDLKIDYIIQKLMNLPAPHRVENSYLLDADGKVLVSSAQAGRRFEAKIYPQLELRPLDFAPVVAAVRQQRTGLQIRPGNSPRIYAYARIPAVGWYLVTVSQLTDTLATPLQASPPP